jgi:transcriptional regulator with XRE-family HTH domain
MTPFGAKLRELRTTRHVTLKQMSADLQLSSAYLSALEHGKRGRPSPVLLIQICQYFHLILNALPNCHIRASRSIHQGLSRKRRNLPMCLPNVSAIWSHNWCAGFLP